MEKNIHDISVSLSKLNEEDLLNKIFLTCFKLNFPVAFWKLPTSDEKNIIVEFSHKPNPQRIHLDQQTSGFAFSPFINSEIKNAFLIQPDFYYNLKTRQLTINASFEKEPLINEFLKKLVNNESLPLSSLLKNLPTSPSHNKDKKEYTTLVRKAIEAIKDNEFKKVVLARQQEVKLSINFNPVHAFNSLCKEQSDSFVSLVYIPETGLWIGASPELLVSISKENIFRTTALAGTQRLNEGEELSKAVWTQKEIEEQALVNRYIISCFKTIRLREYEEDGPRTVRAGNLIHLKTDFSVNINEVNFPDLGSVMLDLLHPTSAVCGMPKESALNFIESYEGADRKFYSGFIGPVNIENECHIFVNIRCAEIESQRAILYSGAGITLESNPEKEFEETEMKMKIMENILMMNFELNDK